MSGADYITEADLAAMFGKSPRTTRRRRSTGDCPPFVRLGRGVVYPRAGVDAWTAARTFKSNADEVARRRMKQGGADASP